MIDRNLDPPPAPDPDSDAAPSPAHRLPPEPDESNGRHRNVFELIRDIKNGVISTSNLSADDRRLCVAQLAGEGLSVGEIAQVLNVSTRTVTRDRQVIHEQNAIQPDARLGALFAGRLAAEYEATAARIRRVTRDKNTPPAAKIDGEYKCFDMADRLVQRLQSMGFLPTAAQRIQSDLTHNLGDLSSMADLQKEMQRLVKIERDVQGMPPPSVAPPPPSPPAAAPTPVPPLSPPAPSVVPPRTPATPPAMPLPTASPPPSTLPPPAPPAKFPSASPPASPATPPAPERPKTGIEIYLEVERKRREERCRQ